MSFENINEYLTIIVTNDNIVNKENKHLFTYKDTNENTHGETLEYFIKENNLELENINMFETSINLTKMGHIIFINIACSNDLIIFLPDIHSLSNTQKYFISMMQCELQYFENVHIAIYDKKQDNFYEHNISKEEVFPNSKVLTKK